MFHWWKGFGVKSQATYLASLLGDRDVTMKLNSKSNRTSQNEFTKILNGSKLNIKLLLISSFLF